MKFIKYENIIVNIENIESVTYSEIEMHFNFKTQEKTFTEHESQTIYLSEHHENITIHKEIFIKFLEFIENKDDVIFDISYHQAGLRGELRFSFDYEYHGNEKNKK
jgi:hypothetical protein